MEFANPQDEHEAHFKEIMLLGSNSSRAPVRQNTSPDEGFLSSRSYKADNKRISFKDKRDFRESSV